MNIKKDMGVDIEKLKNKVISFVVKSIDELMYDTDDALKSYEITINAEEDEQIEVLKAIDEILNERDFIKSTDGLYEALVRINGDYYCIAVAIRQSPASMTITIMKDLWDECSPDFYKLVIIRMLKGE